MLQQKDRNLGLDIIRATAIVSVFLCHVMAVFYSYTSGKAEIIFNYLTWAGGFYGVELFFVLSGFLIGGIFIDKVVEPVQQDRSQPLKPLILDFWLRRWIRTLPSYYLFILINLLLLPVSHSVVDGRIMVYFTLFLQGFSNLKTSFFGVSWSLAIEEWFYLLLPFFFLLFLVCNRKADARKNFVSSLLLLLLIPWVLKLRLVLSGTQTDLEPVLHYQTQYKLDSIFYGLLLSYLYTRSAVRNWLTVHARKLFATGLFGLLLSFAYSFFLVLKTHPNPWALLLFGPLCSVSIMACFPFLIGYKRPEHKGKLIAAGITKISLVSYSLYLCHVPVLYLTRYLFEQSKLPQTIGNSILLAVANIVLSYFISVFLYRKFEIPVLKWRDTISLRINKKHKTV
ncbi:MAG TPA: acyltransferase [Chitinophagaceae bacterium]|nr:acyltransferase [Chitinophagaceae bacterium]